MIELTILTLVLTVLAIGLMEYQFKQVKVRTSEYLTKFEPTTFSVFYNSNDGKLEVYEDDTIGEYIASHRSYYTEKTGVVSLGKL